MTMSTHKPLKPRASVMTGNRTRRLTRLGSSHTQAAAAIGLALMLTTASVLADESAYGKFKAWLNRAGPAPAAVQVTPAPGTGMATLRFDRAVIVDGAATDRPVPVGTMFVPHGWPTEGGMKWSLEAMCTDGMQLSWSARSPDHKHLLGFVPQFRWEHNNTGNPSALKPGCTQHRIGDAKTYLAQAVQFYWRGARVLDFKSRPDLATHKRPVVSQGVGGSRITQTSDAGQVLFAFERDGVEMRGMLVATIDFAHTQMPTVLPSGEPLTFLNAFAWPMFVAFAPQGQLDFGYVEAMRASYEPDAAYLRLVTDHINKVRMIEIKGAGDRANIYAATTQHVNALINEGWKANQRSADQRATAFSQMIRGVDPYVDAHGKKVELASGYGNAWKLDDGSYLLSTQANFDPWRDLGVRGQRLENQR